MKYTNLYKILSGASLFAAAITLASADAHAAGMSKGNRKPAASKHVQQVNGAAAAAVDADAAVINVPVAPKTAKQAAMAKKAGQGKAVAKAPVSVAPGAAAGAEAPKAAAQKVAQGTLYARAQEAYQEAKDAYEAAQKKVGAKKTAAAQLSDRDAQTERLNPAIASKLAAALELHKALKALTAFDQKDDDNAGLVRKAERGLRVKASVAEFSKADNDDERTLDALEESLMADQAFAYSEKTRSRLLIEAPFEAAEPLDLIKGVSSGDIGRDEVHGHIAGMTESNRTALLRAAVNAALAKPRKGGREGDDLRKASHSVLRLAPGGVFLLPDDVPLVSPAGSGHVSDAERDEAEHE